MASWPAEARLFQRSAGGFEFGLDLRQRRQVREFGFELVLLRQHFVTARRQAAQAVLQFGDFARHALAQRLVVGDLAGQLVVLGLGGVRLGARLVARLLGGLGPLLFAHALLFEAAALGFEIANGGFGVVLAALLAREILHGLLQAGFRLQLGRRRRARPRRSAHRAPRAGAAARRQRPPRRCAAAAAPSRPRPAPWWRGRPGASGRRPGPRPPSAAPPESARSRSAVASFSASTAASARRIWSERLR